MPPEFHFLRPGWLMLLIPLAVLLWLLLRKRNQANAWQHLVDPHLLQHLLIDVGGRARRLPFILLGLGWLIVVLALAGPTWKKLPQPAYQVQDYRVILLDLSPSMNTTDRPPSRLAQARFEVLDILRRSQEGQTALIAFGAEPYVVSPLTTDVETIALQVPSLKTELLPVDDTQRVDLALQEAALLLQQAAAPEGKIILVTDSLTYPAAAIETARAVAQSQYRVSVLAMADIDEQSLRSLAVAGDGVYVQARAGENDLNLLLPELSRTRQPDAKRNEDASADQWQEEGPWLLLALLPLAAFGFRRGWLSPLLLVILVMPPVPGYAMSWDDWWWSPDQQGLHKFQQGEAEQAAKLFERQDWQAAAQYAAGDYQQALGILENHDASRHAYNRGNALAHVGRLQDALQAYELALEKNPQDADARHNRDLIADLLAQQRNFSTQPEQQPNMSASGAGDQDEPEPSSDESETESESGSESSAGQQQQEAESSEANGDSQQGGEAEQAGETGETGEPGESGESGENASQQQASSAEAGEEQQDVTADLQSSGDPDESSEHAAAGQKPQQEQLQSGMGEEQDQNADQGSVGAPGLEDLMEGDRINAEQQASGPSQERASQQGDPETEQAVQQMLRRVEDDPSGLLRQRFLLQHLRRQGKLP